MKIVSSLPRGISDRVADNFGFESVLGFIRLRDARENGKPLLAFLRSWESQP